VSKEKIKKLKEKKEEKEKGKGNYVSFSSTMLKETFF